MSRSSESPTDTHCCSTPLCHWQKLASLAATMKTAFYLSERPFFFRQAKKQLYLTEVTASVIQDGSSCSMADNAARQDVPVPKSLCFDDRSGADPKNMVEIF
jgi:hypothetical protein